VAHRDCGQARRAPSSFGLRAGFVIVGMYQACFGVASFDLLKPKVFASGAVFLFLVGAASLLSGRTFNVLWWEGKHIFSDKPENRHYELMATAPLIFVLSSFLSSQAGILIEYGQESRLPLLLW
jgi:hypothetical protein